MASILDKIGNTPLVEIKKLNPNPNVTLLAKIESCNPGGSVKDRIAKATAKTNINPPITKGLFAGMASLKTRLKPLTNVA